MTKPVAQEKPLDLIAVLRAKTWEELEALEQDGRVLFPDVIRFREKDGKLRDVAIAVRVLREPDRRKARVAARKRFAEEGLDPDRDADQFAVLDRLHQLALAIRDPQPPHTQHMTAEILESHYDLASLDEIWERYQVYEERTDPRLEITDEPTMWAAIGAVAKAGNVLPLAGLAPRFQQSCIVFMAKQSLTSPTFKLFLDSIDSSTPAS